MIREKHIALYHSIGEKDLAGSVTQMLLDLIITSACNDWIPDEEKAHSQKVFCRYMMAVLGSSSVSIRNRLRYLLFGISGSRGYKLIAKSVM